MSAPETKVAGILIGLLDMENEVRRVEQWAEVLCALGAGGNDLSVDAVYVIGEALERVGKALREQFRAMHAVASESGGSGALRVILAFLALAQIRWAALDLARAAHLTDCAEEAYQRAAARRWLADKLMARAHASR